MDVKAIDTAAVNVLLWRAPARDIARFRATQRAIFSGFISAHPHEKQHAESVWKKGGKTNLEESSSSSSSTGSFKILRR